MRISELDLSVASGWQTLSARVDWEKVDREPQRIHFRAPESLLPMDANVNPFVIAAAVPAMAAGEIRITTEWPLDPVLVEGLPSALAILHRWCLNYGEGWQMPELVAPVAALRAPENRDTASFYSGGVDSTFTLLRNHALIPEREPGHIRHAFLVYGLDLGFRAGKDERPVFAEFVNRSAPGLRARGVTPVCIESNLRQLDSRSGFWGRAFNGFALSAVAQLFPESIEQVLIGTSGERLSESVQTPWGSHPILHSYLNTSVVQTRSPYVEFSRLPRLRLIISDADARINLRVCFSSRSGELNCGKCEKCVRTRVGLMLCGSDPSLGFAGPPMSRELLLSVAISSRLGQAEHEELRDALLAQGHKDLAAAEDELLERWRRYEYWRQGRGWKGWLRRKRDGLLRGRPS